MTWVLSADVGDATRKLVLIGYANHAHKGGRHSWASKDTIAEYANCSKRTVQRHVDALLAAGWLRHGDQQQVAHLRADRRPVVYDVAMNEATRAEWAAAAAAGRGDNLSPRASEPGTRRGDEAVSTRDAATGGQPVTPSEGHGVTHGVTQPCPPRGDTAVSTEPYLNQELPPLPPASGGRPCAKPGPTPHPNCRGCGTTNRQLADQRRRDEAARRRQTEQARLQAERELLAARSRPAEEVADLLAATRNQIAQTRRTA